MKRTCMSFVISLLVGTCAATRASQSTTPSKWISIMPGETLKGWSVYPWPPGPGSDKLPLDKAIKAWEFRADSNVLFTAGRPHTHILTDTDFSDVAIKLQFRYLKSRGNSGIFLRMVPGKRIMHQVELKGGGGAYVMGGRAVNGKVAFLEVGGKHTPNKWGVKDKLKSGEWVLDKKASRWQGKIPHEKFPIGKPKINPPGQWNSYTIICYGPYIAVIANGTLGCVIGNAVSPSGRIGFESEGSPIEFRNIQIKNLEKDADILKVIQGFL